MIALLTWLMSVAGYAHILAAPVDSKFFVLAGQAGATDHFWRFFTPMLYGNILGGVTLVAGLIMDR